MRRFAFGREVPSLRGERGKLAYTGPNHFTCLLTLAPFVSSADTFPDKRGQLTVCILSFIYKHTETAFFICVILVFFVFAILIFLFSGVKISVFFLKTDISFIFILLLYQLYCKPKNIFS